VYAHLPLSAAVVAFGVATEDIKQLSVDHAVEGALWWFICLSVGFYLAAVAWVDFLTETQTPQLGLQRARASARCGAGRIGSGTLTARAFWGSATGTVGSWGGGGDLRVTGSFRSVHRALGG